MNIAMGYNKRWVINDRYDHVVYLTQERWEHIIDPVNHPEMIAFEDHLKLTIKTGKRQQDPLNPRKYRYTQAFDDLILDNTHIVVIVLFGFSIGPNDELAPNNYVVTAYQKEIG